MTEATTPVRGQRLPRAERRSQLLEAAQEVFVERGYHAAAMEDIAERAGVSKPVLYLHFPGKLELYLAILDQQVEVLTGLVRERLAAAPDQKSKVYATIAAHFEYVTSPGSAFSLVYASDLTNEAAVRERLEAFEHGCSSVIAEHIVLDTGLPPDHADLLAASLAGTAQVAARSWLANPGTMSKDEAARATGHLAWRGLGGYPSRAVAQTSRDGNDPAAPVVAAGAPETD